MKKTILFLVLALVQLFGFAQAPNISYPNPEQTYKIGEKIAVLSPINTGGTMTYDTNIVFAGSGTGETVFIPQINRPQGVTVDVLGNVYLADTDNNLIRKISPTGYISPFAGSSIAGSTNGIGTAASFNSPNGIAVDGSGNFYVTDRDNNKIRKITQAGVVSTFAGSGTAGSTNGSGTVASFNNLSGIAVDVSGNVYVTESLNNKIRKITPTGVVSTFAGSGLQGSADGIGTVASFNYPSGIAVDASGNVYVADRGNYKIRKITPAGVVSTFAGSGVRGSADGTGTAASFGSPNGVAIDTSGNIYITGDDYSKIRMITSTGVVSSFYSGVFGNLPNGDSVRAKSNGGVVIDATGTIYVSDSQNSQIIKTTSSDKYYTSELPAGLYINSYTGDISGTPTKISPVTTYCVTAKKLNYYGSTFCNIKIDVVSKPIITYDTPQYYDVGDIITSLSPTNAGSPVTGYTISPSLPIGLSFDTSSGIISGTPTVITSAATYTVTASNSYGSGNFNIVIATGNFKPIISYITPLTFTVGNAITPLWPTNSGSP
ncbi:MAG: SMP-30/gluconolactonase/LRE family protein, partial [Flavobacteriaceae bacterium]|nr:SMP-30/gluconolactonase/LRE family protein [Flavobacteriaceae bacterium]